MEMEGEYLVEECVATSEVFFPNPNKVQTICEYMDGGDLLQRIQVRAKH